MAFLLYLQPGVETTLVPCLWFNAKLENICCPTSMCFLMGHANTSYKKAWFCQHLGGVVSLMLSKNVMLWTRVICSVGIKSCKSICAPGDMSWYSNKKQRTNALFPTHENKLLSHQTFEVTVEYTRGGQCPAQPVKHSPAGRQAGCLLCPPGMVAHRPRASAASWCSGDAISRCLTHRRGSLLLLLQKEAAFTPAESHGHQRTPSCCLRWEHEGRLRPWRKDWPSVLPRNGEHLLAGVQPVYKPCMLAALAGKCSCCQAIHH